MIVLKVPYDTMQLFGTTTATYGAAIYVTGQTLLVYCIGQSPPVTDQYSKLTRVVPWRHHKPAILLRSRERP